LTPTRPAPTVVLLGTHETKGAGYAFVREQVERTGCTVLMVNAGILGDPDYPVEFGRREVAAAAGADIDDLVAAGDRGPAVTAMAEGAGVIVEHLLEAGRLDGILGMGGSGGSSIIAAAMRRLPVGVPKMLVSTMASGDTRPYVDTADIAMTYSVVDIAGVNRISARILGNAAAGISAMAAAHAAREEGDDARPLVGATMYGTTTPCVDGARRWLEARGYEVLVFHATGTGGRSMERLMASGYITAALDVTTTELADEVAGGRLTAGPDRLETAGSLGLPQVVSLGAVDQVTFSPPDSVPEAYRGRNVYRHNPTVTLVRTNEEECDRLGRIIAAKLNAAEGPVSLFVPLRGTSSYAVEGAVFHDPAADAALFAALREEVGGQVDLVEMDTHINDPAFAEAMAHRLDTHYRAWSAARR
jgi:uncharacterized protein (UPF0261 family)